MNTEKGISKEDSFKSKKSSSSARQDEHFLENFMDSVDGNDSSASYQDLAGEDDEDDSLGSIDDSLGSSILNNENYDIEQNHDHVLMETTNTIEQEGRSLSDLLDLNTENLSNDEKFEKMPAGTTVSFHFCF